MAEIIKINHLDYGSGSINEHIYVFAGNDQEVTSKNIFFGKDELSRISKNNIKVTIIPEYIWFDDTIETIKKKIMEHISKISYEEIYLFGETYKHVNTFAIYNELTQNEKIPLKREMLTQILQNFHNVDVSALETKDEYDYEDLLALKLDEREQKVKMPVGQKFNIELKYHYTVNPFDVVIFDQILEKYSEHIITTQNKSLLFNIGNIINNTIFLCTAPSVIDYVAQKGLNEKIFLKVYFPNLFFAPWNIDSVKKFEGKKHELRERNSNFLSQAYKNNNKNVSLFHEIFYTKKSDLNYNFSGIKQLSFVIHPSYKISIPLEIIFKLFKTSQEIPLIKYNPGNRRENVYRLFTEQISKNGKKIPLLSRSKIFKLRKKLARHKQVSLFIVFQKEEISYEIECNFEKNGDIIINLDSTGVISIEKTEEVIKEVINPLLGTIGNFLGQSGYSYVIFNKLDDENISIKNISHATSLNITKKLNINDFLSCVSSMFNVLQEDLDKQIYLRFKRVSYFNEMESQDAYITEMLQKGKTLKEVVGGLENNFQLTYQAAYSKVEQYLSSADIEISMHEKRKLKVKNNPGFPIFIRRKMHSNTILIDIENINHIYYLKTLPIYLDTLIRLTQDAESSDITKLCGKKEEMTGDEDIIADIESTDPKLSDGKIVYEDDDDEDDLFSYASEDEYGENDEEGEEIEEDAEAQGDAEEPDEDGEAQGDAEEPEEDREAQDDAEEPEEDGEAQDDTGEPEEVGEAEGAGEEAGGSEVEEFFNDNVDFGNLQFGGGEDLKINVTNMKLNNPNPFTKRMENRDPYLFLKKMKGKFTAYSRICASNIKRQPVILTDEEKEKIDKDHPGSYSFALKYGSKKRVMADGVIVDDPSKEYWYICPRYWCLKTNTSLTEAEVKAGVCGGEDAIISPKSKTVKEGKSIFEFTSDKHIGTDGKYQHYGPAFIQDRHPDNLCLPCCFKRWDTAGQRRKRDECNKKQKKKKKRKVILDDYIKSAEKFPLDKGRWGLLPLSVQKVLYHDNKKCYVSTTSKELKINHTCFLRHGVENNQNQSFIACIADIYSEMTRMGQHGIITISRMKEIIINSISLDNFITYQNGSLVKIFKTSKPVEKAKYKTNEIVKKGNEKYLQKIISAYENFISYLRDDDVIIDYEYLWDIICQPNVKLFASGLNIIILNIPNNDVTDNIEIICPSNYNITFDLEKHTVFFVSRRGFYEPIYGYKNFENHIEKMISFLYKSPNTPRNIKSTIDFVKGILSKCAALPSLPKKYEFEENISFDHIKRILDKISKYEIKTQVINYNNKTIGVVVEDDKKAGGFIPTRPSAINNAHEYLFVDQNKWNDYGQTKSFLKNIYTLSNKKIPCAPKFKVEEDGLIVGIITITNQFIPLSKPSENLDDDLIVLKEYNFIKSDINHLFEEKIDKERILISKKVKLETSFFNIFRNTVRILLQEYKNKKIRKEIEDIIKTPYILYSKKLDLITTQLQELLSKHVNFVELSPDVLNNIDTLSNCLKLNSAGCSSKTYCLSSGDNCVLLIPNKHLISDYDNEKIYYGRMADELLRYGRIRLFIFKPRSFISFQKINYNLDSNEIILMEHLLDEGYFEDLVPLYNNPYLTNKKTFYDTQPDKSVAYSSKINTRRKEKLPNERCTSKGYFKGDAERAFWKKIFKKEFEQITFKKTADCSWKFLFFILNRFLKQGIGLQAIKQELINEYNSLNDAEKIYKIMDIQGKKNIVTKIRAQEISLENAILSENYYITNLDIFLMVKKFKIPTVFISKRPLKETGAADPKKIISFLYNSPSCCVIQTPPRHNKNYNEVRSYKVIFHENKIFIPIIRFPLEFQNLVLANDKELTFGDYYDRIVSKKFLTKGVKKLKDTIKLN